MNKTWLFLCLSTAAHIGALSIPGFAPLPEQAPIRNQIELVDVPIGTSTSSSSAVPAVGLPKSSAPNIQPSIAAKNHAAEPSQQEQLSASPLQQPQPNITPVTTPDKLSPKPDEPQTTAQVPAITPPVQNQKTAAPIAPAVGENLAQLPQPKAAPAAAASSAASNSNITPQPGSRPTLAPSQTPAPSQSGAANRTAAQSRSAGKGSGASGGQQQTASSSNNTTGGRSGTGSGNSNTPGTAQNSQARAIGDIPKPVYPPLARRKGIEGTVILSVEVLANGRTGQVKVVKSSGRKDMDQAAVAALKSFHEWQPKIENGKKVTSWLTYEVQFKLKD